MGFALLPSPLPFKITSPPFGTELTAVGYQPVGMKPRTSLRASLISTTAAALASVPESESRVILATGSYIGEGFDDARLDTLFLAMPISWKGTLQQYVGRLHRLHDNKRFVQVYDYVDNYVLMLARMYERRLKGYAAIGYVIEQETIPPHTPAAGHP